MFSVKGTKTKGKMAAPIFQVTKANERKGNVSLSTFHSSVIWALAAPERGQYANCDDGGCMRTDHRHLLECRSKLIWKLSMACPLRLYVHETSHKACCNGSHPFIFCRPIEPAHRISTSPMSNTIYALTDSQDHPVHPNQQSESPRSPALQPKHS